MLHEFLSLLWLFLSGEHFILIFKNFWIIGLRSCTHHKNNIISLWRVAFTSENTRPDEAEAESLDVLSDLTSLSGEIVKYWNSSEIISALLIIFKLEETEVEYSALVSCVTFNSSNNIYLILENSFETAAKEKVNVGLMS